MIYWFVAISLGTFLLGYMWGLDRGFRNAHRDIVMKQMKKAKSKITQNEIKHKDSVYDPIWSNKPKLRLIKKDEDTRV